MLSVELLVEIIHCAIAGNEDASLDHYAQLYKVAMVCKAWWLVALRPPASGRSYIDFNVPAWKLALERSKLSSLRIRLNRSDSLEDAREFRPSLTQHIYRWRHAHLSLNNTDAFPNLEVQAPMVVSLTLTLGMAFETPTPPPLRDLETDYPELRAL